MCALLQVGGGEKGEMVDSLSSQSAPLKPSGHRQM